MHIILNFDASLPLRVPSVRAVLVTNGQKTWSRVANTQMDNGQLSSPPRHS